MFKLVPTLCLLHVLIHFTYSNVSWEVANPIAEPGTCLSEWYNLLGSMKYGETKPVPNECGLAACGNDGAILYSWCSNVHKPKNCKFVETDRNAPYPKCCKEKYTCD